ncbi:MAG: hypothetical protein ABIO67_09610 [Mycobacteriales bacterium]
MTLTCTDDGLARATTALMIGAPLLMVMGRVLLVPFDDQDWPKVLNAMSAHQGRSDAGWLLSLAASGLLGVTAVVLAQRLRAAGRSLSAGVVIVTAALGWAGSAAISGFGLSMSAMAQAPDRPVQVQVLKDLTSGSTNIVFLMCVAAAVGYAVLAVGLSRAGLASKGAAILLGVGGASTLLTMPGPMQPLLVFAALLLAAGHALVTRP